MDLELRVPAAEHLDGIFDVRAQAFAVAESDRERWTKLVDPSQMVAAFVGPEVVGALNILDFGQWFGGRSVPMGGIATVVVRPEHRGRGVARRLLEKALERMRERGLVVSTLNPATTRVYRAAGWEIGGDLASYKVPTRALQHVPRGVPDRVRRLTSSDWPAVRACYDAVAPPRTGWLDRSDFWWGEYEKVAFADQSFVYGVEGDDGLDAFLTFEQKPSQLWGYQLEVEELVARDATAAQTLWYFLGTHAMQAKDVVIRRGPVEPLLLVLPEQDVRQVWNNRWMHRIVDAPAAIAARGFPSGLTSSVHLDLADGLAPWNAGRWVLEVDGGRGGLRPGGDGDVALTINAFSTLSTGWASAPALAEAGALSGPPEHLAALDAMFAGPAPTILDEF